VANSPEADGKCTLICAVLQKFRRELRAVGLDDLPIGFAVYPLQQKGANEELNQQQKRTEVSGGNNYYGSRQLLVDISFIAIDSINGRFPEALAPATDNQVPMGRPTFRPAARIPAAAAESSDLVWSSFTASNRWPKVRHSSTCAK
jgi:hypothetical protein